jgi:hypothetical protein
MKGVEYNGYIAFRHICDRLVLSNQGLMLCSRLCAWILEALQWHPRNSFDGPETRQQQVCKHLFNEFLHKFKFAVILVPSNAFMFQQTRMDSWEWWLLQGWELRWLRHCHWLACALWWRTTFISKVWKFRCAIEHITILTGQAHRQQCVFRNSLTWVQRFSDRPNWIPLAFGGAYGVHWLPSPLEPSWEWISIPWR